MATLHVLKVFVGEGGIGGNPLGVFLEVKLSSKDATRERILFLFLRFTCKTLTFSSAPGRIRTCDPRIRSPSLYVRGCVPVFGNPLSERISQACRSSLFAGVRPGHCQSRHIRRAVPQSS